MQALVFFLDFDFVWVHNNAKKNSANIQPHARAYIFSSQSCWLVTFCFIVYTFKFLKVTQD